MCNDGLLVGGESLTDQDTFAVLAACRALKGKDDVRNYPKAVRRGLIAYALRLLADNCAMHNIRSVSFARLPKVLKTFFPQMLSTR